MKRWLALSVVLLANIGSGARATPPESPKMIPVDDSTLFVSLALQSPVVEEFAECSVTILGQPYAMDRSPLTYVELLFRTDSARSRLNLSYYFRIFLVYDSANSLVAFDRINSEFTDYRSWIDKFEQTQGSRLLRSWTDTPFVILDKQRVYFNLDSGRYLHPESAFGLVYLPDADTNVVVFNVETSKYDRFQFFDRMKIDSVHLFAPEFAELPSYRDLHHCCHVKSVVAWTHSIEVRTSRRDTTHNDFLLYNRTRGEIVNYGISNTHDWGSSLPRFHEAIATLGKLLLSHELVGCEYGDYIGRCMVKMVRSRKNEYWIAEIPVKCEESKIWRTVCFDLLDNDDVVNARICYDQRGKRYLTDIEL